MTSISNGFHQKEKSVYSLEKVKNNYAELYARVNDFTKIKLKCWVAYSEYMARDEGCVDHLSFDHYCNFVDASLCIGHINSGEIDVTDLGGKDAAIAIVKTWYGIL